MSVRPVDVQLTVPGSSEQARARPPEAALAQAAGEAGVRQVARQGEAESKRVHAREPSHRVRGDGAREREQAAGGETERGPGDRRSEGDAAPKEPGKGRRLDVRA